jgi:integrase
MTTSIQSKSARKALKPRKEPYWSRIETGFFIGYRKLDQGDGTWIARKRLENGRQKYQALGTFEQFDHAVKEARKWAMRLDQGVTDFAGTIEAACKAYVQYIKQKKGSDASRDPEGRFTRLVYGTAFGRVPLEKLNPARVRDWLSAQIPSNANPEELRKAKASANRNLNTLKAALNRALKDQLVSTDAGWKSVSRYGSAGKGRTGFLSLEERQNLRANASDALRALITGLLMTMARPGELAHAKVADFDPKAGTLRLDGKTGQRTIPLSTKAVEFFNEQSRSKLPTAPLITSDLGTQWNKDRWKKQFRQAAKASGLPNEIVLYSLRHAAISEAISSGMGAFTVAKIAGTSTKMIDDNYGHLQQEIARSALNNLEMY